MVTVDGCLRQAAKQISKPFIQVLYSMMVLTFSILYFCLEATLSESVDACIHKKFANY